MRRGAFTPEIDSAAARRCFAALGCLLSAVALSASASAADVASEFQTTARDAEFAKLMSKLNLNAEGIKLTYKDGGTSVGLKIEQGDEKLGKWLPRNSAGNPESQVVSYQLGRFLGMSDLVMPSAYYKLDGAALATFQRILQNARENNRWRRENRDLNLAAIAQNPSGLTGVFTPYVEPKSEEAVGLANSSANTINSADPIARFIRADGPVPSASNRMSLRGLKGGSESELELARQFSQIMVLDILTGQWDRWSGGNVEAATDGTRVNFVARDNGGASMTGPGTFAKYSRIVTRFDRAQMERVERLVQMLSDRDQSAQLVAALQLSSDPRFLLGRAQNLLAFVRTQDSQHSGAAFFQPH
jgi:hypothetical protein